MNKQNASTNIQKGAILLESLLAIVVFTIIILAIIPMLSFLIRKTDRSKYEGQATLLLQESLEAGYHVCTTNWLSCSGGQYRPARGPVRWKLIPTEEPEKDLQTQFDRKMFVRVACRKSDGEIVNMDGGGCDTSKYTRDPNTKILISEVTWSEADQPKKLSANLILVNYETQQ